MKIWPTKIERPPPEIERAANAWVIMPELDVGGIRADLEVWLRLTPEALAKVSQRAGASLGDALIAVLVGDSVEDFLERRRLIYSQAVTRDCGLLLDGAVRQRLALDSFDDEFSNGGGK